jgi:3-oxoadipate enol-lactonase
LPFITFAGTRFFYRLEGQADAPVLMLSHSLGCDHGMWLPQIPGLLQHFQILRYDTRGHGASDAPAGDYTLDQLGRDALALADALGFPAFAFCGLSMGSAVGQWLAINAPQRLTSLVLANSSARFDPMNLEKRRETVLAQGMPAISEAVMQRFFSPETLARNDAYAASVRSVLLGTSAQGYAGCCAALRDADFSQSLDKIRTPTLVIVGDRDQGTPWTGHGELLARGIQGAQVAHLPAAHLSNLEEPEAFTKTLSEFLREPATGPVG